MLMAESQVIDLPVAGMDCADCTRHVRSALAALPGVSGVDVYLTSEKARVTFDPALVNVDAMRGAVARAGYTVPDPSVPASDATAAGAARRPALLFAALAASVLAVVVFGEWLGLLDWLNEAVPLPLGAALVLAAGWPVLKKVAWATVRGQIISHSLMTLGAVAALAMGQWATALVVVFFMRVGDAVEGYTAVQARRALQDLAALAPQAARVVRSGAVIEIPAADVLPGEEVIVRPGEQAPVDGIVVEGHALVNQAAITGESMPLEAGPGATVYAAALVGDGYLRIRTVHAGADSAFGRAVRLVEEAETQRGRAQLMADRFATVFLPLVAGIALVTFLLSHDPMAATAVLVVACSCSFALATPIAVMASIGRAAQQGILIKGGATLEALARADVLLIDKTGTLTLGEPWITAVTVAAGAPPPVASAADPADELIHLAASAERYSEHPLAGAVRAEAARRSLPLAEPADFRAAPGRGVSATVEGVRVAAGRAQRSAGAADTDPGTVIEITVDGVTAGWLSAEDRTRPAAPAALAELAGHGIARIELLTGDNAAAAARVAVPLGIPYRAGLLPEDKIAIVRSYQAQGHTVVMIGDGVNDAPALAQADAGIAMGGRGAAVAAEAAHVVLLRDDWAQVPMVFGIAWRTTRVVRQNLAFTGIYNLAGISLAALGLLPPALAAAAQSIPDLGILGNSARLLKE
jgi:Cd2+/Zn2+-exporting ATPase/Cu+-exporting ATPase